MRNTFSSMLSASIL